MAQVVANSLPTPTILPCLTSCVGITAIGQRVSGTPDRPQSRKHMANIMNHRERDKIDEERCYLDGFLARLPDRPLGDITHADPPDPDFFLRTPETCIGIEVMRLLQRGPTGTCPPRELESHAQKIVDEARKLYDARKGRPVRLDVQFNDGDRLFTNMDKETRRNLAEFVAETAFQNYPPVLEPFLWDYTRKCPTGFPAYLNAICNIVVLAADSIDHAKWTADRGGWEAEFTVADIEDQKRKKEHKATKYRQRCKELWLLMVAEGSAPSSYIDLVASAKIHAYKSSFDRLFVYRHGSIQEPIELRIIGQ
jgi:hypothetical protein